MLLDWNSASMMKMTIKVILTLHFFSSKRNRARKMRSERACDDGRPHCVIIIGRRKKKKALFLYIFILLGNKDVTA